MTTQNNKSRLLLVSLCLILSSSAYAISSKCQLNYVWGHGGTVTHNIKNKKYKGQSVGMGCWSGSAGKVETTMFQPGSNGDWMKKLSLKQNGGLNPILDRTNYEYAKEGYFSKFSSTREKQVMYSMDQNIEGVTHSEIERIVMSVGFMRLAHYQFASLIKEADSAVQNGCKKVEIAFQCPDNYKGAPYGQLGERVWNRRLKRATAVNIDKKEHHKLIDAAGFPFIYEKKTCTQDVNGQKIETVPRKCGQVFSLNKETIQNYKSSTCGAFLKKLSSKYRTRTFDDRQFLFNDLMTKSAVQKMNDSEIEVLDESQNSDFTGPRDSTPAIQVEDQAPESGNSSSTQE